MFSPLGSDSGLFRVKLFFRPDASDVFDGRQAAERLSLADVIVVINEEMEVLAQFVLDFVLGSV